MDKLEEHIRKNRDDLDRYNPSTRIWKRIKRKLITDKSQVKRWISIAAMIIVVLGSAMVLLRQRNKWPVTSSEVRDNSGQIPVNPQLKETEIYYNNLVNSLYREATPLLTSHPEVRKELTADISQLDRICSDIKKDLKDNVANQEVVEALIQNYRIKIRLLEDMLTILKENEVNPGKNKSHEL
ncbi:MAG: hypothetical protein EPN88_01230 [Bacteroidetes bacterium]|nr:MAG: hypothetical protein EPN88_01230 [Bacteroidota bacterium]